MLSCTGVGIQLQAGETVQKLREQDSFYRGPGAQFPAPISGDSHLSVILASGGSKPLLVSVGACTGAHIPTQTHTQLKVKLRAGEFNPQLRMLVALPENPSSVPSTHLAVYNHL